MTCTNCGRRNCPGCSGAIAKSTKRECPHCGRRRCPGARVDGQCPVFPSNVILTGKAKSGHHGGLASAKARSSRRMREDLHAKVVGEKHDHGKLRWSLLPFDAVREIVKVLMKGADKYTVGGWEHVDNARDRYFDALIRHVTAWYEGERNDPEWGLHHLAHAGCCLLFLLALSLRGKIDSAFVGVDLANGEDETVIVERVK